MKINLLLDNPLDVRSGYLNFDPYAPVPDTVGRVKTSVNNLDEFVSNGEAAEIVAHDILGYFPPHEVDDILSNWLGKLAHYGTLAISVVDAREVSRKLLANVISIEAANSLLHGAQAQPWQLRRSSFTLPVVVDVLTTRGYKIISKRVQNNMATVVVQRG